MIQSVVGRQSSVVRQLVLVHYDGRQTLIRAHNPYDNWRDLTRILLQLPRLLRSSAPSWSVAVHDVARLIPWHGHRCRLAPRVPLPHGPRERLRASTTDVTVDKNLHEV